jgi:hypothetical protein
MRIAFLMCTFLASGWFVAGQQISADHPTASSVLNHMTSTSWTERRQAFDDANELLRSGKVDPEEVDRLRLGVVRLLLKESNGGLKEPDDEPQTVSAEGDDENQGEDKGDYYSGLVTFVAKMHDETCHSSLAGCI